VTLLHQLLIQILASAKSFISLGEDVHHQLDITDINCVPYNDISINGYIYKNGTKRKYLL
jgi:hypothetical protein